MVPRVHVRDLGNSGDKEELRRVFSKFGGLINVWIANNPPGFAYIFYSTFEDAERAVNAMDGKRVCGVRVRVELSPVEDRRRSARGRGGGGGYDSRDSFRERGGGRDRDRDYCSNNKGRERSDDNNSYRRGDSGGGGRSNYHDNNNDYQEHRNYRGRGRGGYRGGNHYEQGRERGGRGGRGGGRDYGYDDNSYGSRDGGGHGGGRGGSYGSGGGYEGRGSRGGRGGRGGGYRDNYDRNYDRGGSRDGNYDDYSRGRGRGRGRYNKQDNYSGGGWKKDNYGGGGGRYNDDTSDRRSGGDMEFRQQRTSRRDDYESKSSYKRDNVDYPYNKYDKEYSGGGRGKGDYHEGGGSHYKTQQYSRWDDDFEEDEGNDYRDRSPHHQNRSPQHQKATRHNIGYQKPVKVSRSRSRSFDSRSFTSSHSRSRSSSPQSVIGGSRVESGKRPIQSHRKARNSDFNSSSRSPGPPASKSRFYTSSIPNAYRDTFEQVGTFRSDSSLGSHHYPENRSKVDYEQRGYSTKGKRDREVSSGVRSVHDMSYSGQGDSGHFTTKERHGGDGDAYSGRDYTVLQSSMADVSPPVVSRRSGQKRRR